MVLKKSETAKTSNQPANNAQTESSDINTENPLQNLTFANIEQLRKASKEATYRNLLLSVIIIIFMTASVLLNKTLLEKCDPKIFNVASSCVQYSKNLVFSSKQFLSEQINKPYILTIGEYGELSLAKEEAIKLLPELKQIDIKKLDNGMYTFQIERFPSKKQAYAYAGKYIKNGFNSVHVRYLPNQ